MRQLSLRVGSAALTWRRIVHSTAAIARSSYLRDTGRATVQAAQEDFAVSRSPWFLVPQTAKNV